VRPFQDRYARERALLQTRPSDLLVNIVTEDGPVAVLLGLAGTSIYRVSKLTPAVLAARNQ
jgi:hypothetical protein